MGTQYNEEALREENRRLSQENQALMERVNSVNHHEMKAKQDLLDVTISEYHSLIQSLKEKEIEYARYITDTRLSMGAELKEMRKKNKELAAILKKLK